MKNSSSNFSIYYAIKASMKNITQLGNCWMNSCVMTVFRYDVLLNYIFYFSETSFFYYIMFLYSVHSLYHKSQCIWIYLLTNILTSCIPLVFHSLHHRCVFPPFFHLTTIQSKNLSLERKFVWCCCLQFHFNLTLRTRINW